MKKFMKKYGFITLMLLGIVAGCIVGAAWPGATALEPFGTLFINMMFCVVVPMVFCSIASAIANMSSAKRAGRIMGITVGTFLSTAAIAAILMYIIVHFIPVFTAAPSYEESGVGTVDIGTLIVNFFTKPDFTELWSRRAILPLIVAAIIFGFGIQMCGGRESRVALLLNDLTDILLKVIKLISYYAPVGFFGFFASLVATHGSDFVSNYARAIGIYYVVSSFHAQFVRRRDVRGKSGWRDHRHRQRQPAETAHEPPRLDRYQCPAVRVAQRRRHGADEGAPCFRPEKRHRTAGARGALR